MKQWLDTSKLARNAAGVSHSCGKWYCCHSNPALDCNIGYVRHTTLPCATLYWLYACICSAIQCSANPICHVSGLLHSALHTNIWMHKPKLSASLSFPLWPDLQWHSTQTQGDKIGWWLPQCNWRWPSNLQLNLLKGSTSAWLMSPVSVTLSSAEECRLLVVTRLKQTIYLPHPGTVYL